MGSVYLRGNSWVIKYKDVNGGWKRHAVGRKHAMTKTMARDILIGIERKVKLGQYDMLDKVAPILKDYAQEYISYQRDIKKIRSHKRSKICVEHFSSFFGQKRLSEITANYIDLYKQKRLEIGVKQNTIARELQVIRNMFYYASKRNKFFGKNPVSESGLPVYNDKKERVLTKEEESRLLKACPEQLREIVLIALITGMRQGEILALRWDWIDFDENEIKLPQTHVKTNKSRIIPVSQKLRTILLERRLKSGGSDFVFPSKNSGTGHVNWVKRSFKTACKKATVDNLRFHDLKHTAITRMVEAGIQIADISKIVGTSYQLIVERYSHQKESLRKAVEILASF